MANLKDLIVNGATRIIGKLYAGKGVDTPSITNLAKNDGIYWDPYVESASDPSDAASITLIPEGIKGGTELRISQMNDANDVVNIMSSGGAFVNGNQIIDSNNIGSQRVDNANNSINANYTFTSNHLGESHGYEWRQFWQWNGSQFYPRFVMSDGSIRDNETMVSYASSAGTANIADKVWTTSHKNDWFIESNWDGTYFQTNAKSVNGGTLDIKVSSAYNADAVNGHSINSDVPANAVFTDTWRPVQNNLTSTSTTDSLSAYQGKVLNEKIDSLHRPMKVIFISDSYGVGAWGNSTTTPWINKAAEKLGLTKNSTYWSSAATGYSFATSTTFETLLRNLSSSISDKAGITHIVVGGGFNDRVMDGDAVKAAISSFISYAKTTYPNAKVCIGFMAWQKPTGSAPLEDNDKTKQYYTWNLLGGTCNNYRNSCADYGATFIEGLQYVLHDYKYLSENVDTVHPNQDGQDALGVKVAEFLRTGACTIAGDQNYGVGNFFTFTPNTTYNVNLFNTRAYQSRNGNTVTLTSLELAQIQVPAITSGFVTDWLPLGTFSNGYLWGHYITMPNSQYLALSVMPTAKINIIKANKIYQADLRIVHGEVQIRIYRNGDSITADKGYVEPFQLTFNAFYC